MTERIVDRLEVIEVDTENGEGFAPLYAAERFRHLLTEADSVRKVRQRVMMRHIRDLRLGLAAFGNILVSRNTPTVQHRLMRNRDHVAVTQLIDEIERLTLGNSRQPIFDVILIVLGGRAVGDAMLQDYTKRGSGYRVLQHQSI